MVRSLHGQAHYSGSYASATMGGFVVYESRLELARLLLADFEPQVRRIYVQLFLLVARAGGRCPAPCAGLLAGVCGGDCPAGECQAGGAAVRSEGGAVRELILDTPAARPGFSGVICPIRAEARHCWFGGWRPC